MDSRGRSLACLFIFAFGVDIITDEPQLIDLLDGDCRLARGIIAIDIAITPYLDARGFECLDHRDQDDALGRIKWIDANIIGDFEYDMPEIGDARMGDRRGWATAFGQVVLPDEGPLPLGSRRHSR